MLPNQAHYAPISVRGIFPFWDCKCMQKKLLCKKKFFFTQKNLFYCSFIRFLSVFFSLFCFQKFTYASFPVFNVSSTCLLLLLASSSFLLFFIYLCQMPLQYLDISFSLFDMLSALYSLSA